MPFFFSGFWMLPMFIMPIMAFLMVFVLYKKGFFNVIFEQFDNHKQHSVLNQDNLLENKDVLEIIKLRYAKGEISTEEYHTLKNELSN